MASRAQLPIVVNRQILLRNPVIEICHSAHRGTFHLLWKRTIFRPQLLEGLKDSPVRGHEACFYACSHILMAPGFSAGFVHIP